MLMLMLMKRKKVMMMMMQYCVGEVYLDHGTVD